MTFIAWLGRRFVLVAYFTGVATFAGGTLGGFLSGSLCRAFTTSDGGERPQLAEAICGSFLRFGSVCLMTAVAIGLVLAWMAWRRSRSDSETHFNEPRSISGAPGREANAQPALDAGLLLVLTFILIATAATTWVAALPALRFLAQNVPVLSQGLDSIVLMPPGFGFGAAATLLLGELGLLLLLSARNPMFPRTYLAIAVTHLGLIVCTRTMLDAIRVVTGAAGSELPMLQSVEAAVAALVPGLTWSLTAQAAGLPLLMLGHVRTLFSPPGTVMGEPRAHLPVVVAEPLKALATAGVGPPEGRGPADGPRLGRKFFIRAVFLAWPLAGRVTIEDFDQARTLTATIVPFHPRPTMEVWLESRERTRIISIESRHLFGLGNRFDVRDGATGELLAVVKKPFAADWLVHSPTGDLAAVVTRESSGLGTSRYVARVGERPVAAFSWSNVLRPSVEADLSEGTEQWLDRRLGVALGVLLFVNLSFLSR